MDDEKLSIVVVYGENKSKCGYCHAEERTSVSFGMDAEKLSVQDYQYLVDRGFRRSGTWLYRPNNFKTCCASYTHRLNVNRFQANKEQKRALRKLDAYLQGTDSVAASASGELQKQPRPFIDAMARPTQTSEKTVLDPELSRLKRLEQALLQALKELQGSGKFPDPKSLPSPTVRVPKKGAAVTDGVSHTSPWPHALAAALRRGVASKQADALLANDQHTRFADSHARSSTAAQSLTAQQTAELLCQQLEGQDIRAAPLNGHINFRACDAHTQLPSQKDQQKTHLAEQGASIRAKDTKSAPLRPSGGGESSKRKSPSERNPEADDGGGRDFEIVTVRNSLDLVDIEFPLYKKYQIHQHKDPPEKVTRKQFVGFLVESPLFDSRDDSDDDSCNAQGIEFGSFHQQYWLDGVLVAVGVVDILPSCLSSKYFFWDPDLAFLSLGRISVLKEIEWVRNAQKTCPTLKYYYMGFYIHTCSKMRYKVKFEPADLLCPTTLRWVPYSTAERQLDSGFFAQLLTSDKQLEGHGDDYEPHTKSAVVRNHASMKDGLEECELINVALSQRSRTVVVPFTAFLGNLADPEDYIPCVVPWLLEAKDHLGDAIETTAIRF